MTRTFKDIALEGKNTGSLRSYITNYESGIFLLSNCEAFFGKAFFRKFCLQICAIDGLEFDVEAHSVEEFGLDERGKRIDAIIGAAKHEAAKKNHKMPCLWRECEHKQFSRALAACPQQNIRWWVVRERAETNPLKADTGNGHIVDITACVMALEKGTILIFISSKESLRWLRSTLRNRLI